MAKLIKTILIFPQPKYYTLKCQQHYDIATLLWITAVVDKFFDMASCSDSVTTDSQKTNSLSNRSDSQPDAEMTETEIRGYLMKRARLSRKWKKQWFLLRNCDLYYSESPQVNKV